MGVFKDDMLNYPIKRLLEKRGFKQDGFDRYHKPYNKKIVYIDFNKKEITIIERNTEYLSFNAIPPIEISSEWLDDIHIFIDKVDEAINPYIINKK